jgi:hypothetical protein
MRLIVDAADYFDLVRQAMMNAERRIILIGWDFDARVRIGPPHSPNGAPATVGRFVLWLMRQKPELQLYLLRWDFGAIKALFRGTTPFTVARWALHKRIHVKLDGAHPFGASHHQKIAVIDDCLAFCGGIDITAHRWDTRDHLDDDPRRVEPFHGSYQPWHDATMALNGPAARALDELARERWRCAGGETLPEIRREAKLWLDGVEPHFTDIDIGIARTQPLYGDAPEVHEIEALYLDMIARAKRTVYVEGQYFASGLIAEAIVRRLQEPGGPEFVLVTPQQAHGWLEQVAMDTARSRLFEAVKHYDTEDRFRIYMPFTAAGKADLCPRQDHGGGRGDVPRRLVQPQQPLAAAGHGMRRGARRDADGQSRHRRPDRRAARRSGGRASGGGAAGGDRRASRNGLADQGDRAATRRRAEPLPVRAPSPHPGRHFPGRDRDAGS